MSFDETGKIVDEYLAVDFQDADYSIVNSKMPIGWREKNIGDELKVLEALFFRTPFDRPPVYSIKLSMGLLRILADTGVPLYDSLWEMVSQQTARQSALICMVCGSKAFRRKIVKGMPCLCKQHYVEYANYLAEKDG